MQSSSRNAAGEAPGGRSDRRRLRARRAHGLRPPGERRPRPRRAALHAEVRQLPRADRAPAPTPTSGPNLDLAFQAARAAGMDQDTIEGVVEAQIENPRPASPEDTEVYMPANLVEGDDASAVAAYVASVAGVQGIKPPEFIAPEFFATNCGGCHTLGAAGTTGTIGPEPRRGPARPDARAGRGPSITDPEAEISPGFPAGVMPANYGETLTPEQLQAAGPVHPHRRGAGRAGGGRTSRSRRPATAPQALYLPRELYPRAPRRNRPLSALVGRRKYGRPGYPRLGSDPRARQSPTSPQNRHAATARNATTAAPRRAGSSAASPRRASEPRRRSRAPGTRRPRCETGCAADPRSTRPRGARGCRR